LAKKIFSVEKALNILSLFNSEVHELRNIEISEMLNIPAATVSGLVFTLKDNGYLDQNDETKKYRLGVELLDRASVFLDQIDIRKIAKPHMEEVRNWCGESVNLALRKEKEVIYIERLLSDHSLSIHLELGKRAPIHTTALGKAIVAFLPNNEFSELFNNYRFFSVTEYSITDLITFKEDIQKIRNLGYAIDNQENEIGGRCIGVPIFDHNHYPFSAVSVSVPIQRLPSNRVNEYGQYLLKVSKSISKKIGCN